MGKHSVTLSIHPGKPQEPGPEDGDEEGDTGEFSSRA